MTELTGAEILAIPMDPERNDAHATSIGGYLHKLLSTLWFEEMQFDSKRPFGNSSWQWEVYAALADADALPATYDDDGYLDEIDTVEADGLMQRAIATLGGGP